MRKACRRAYPGSGRLTSFPRRPRAGCSWTETGACWPADSSANERRSWLLGLEVASKDAILGYAGHRDRAPHARRDAERDEMAYPVSFGMGCFHFAVKGSVPFRFLGSEYTSEVRSLLESIPSVDAVGVDADEEFDNYSVEVVEELPRMEEGTGTFPRAVFVSIRFEIYLPSRVQQDLVSRRRLPEPPSERYRVLIKYGYHMPVAFVEPVGEEAALLPADGALVVAEFLRRELPETSSERVFLECMEPIPFPAHCYLGPASDDLDSTHSWRFRAETLPLPGSSAVLFHFNPQKCASVQEAKDTLYHGLTEEVSLFYAIHCSAKRRQLAWQELTRRLDDLIAVHTRPGAAGFLKKVVATPGESTLLALQAAHSEADLAGADSALRTSRSAIYSGGLPTYLEEYVDKAMEEAPAYPYDELNRSVNLIHLARTKTVENIVLLAAAVVSGALGAVLIKWLSG